MSDINCNSEKLEKKRQQEIAVMRTMTEIYCKGNHKHKDGLCSECQKLMDYATVRVEKCPFMAEKSFCANCKVHCYKKDMREKVKEVMRYSGPRMLFVKPHLVLLHAFHSLKDKVKKR